MNLATFLPRILQKNKNIGDEPNLKDLKNNQGNMEHQESIFENVPRQQAALPQTESQD